MRFLQPDTVEILTSVPVRTLKLGLRCAAFSSGKRHGSWKKKGEKKNIEKTATHLVVQAHLVYYHIGEVVLLNNSFGA